MNLPEKGIMLMGVSFLLFSSFIFDSPFLNGNIYIKQFGIELLIGIISAVWFGILVFKRDRYYFKLSIVDVVVVSLLTLYSCFFFFTDHNSINFRLPFYYGMYYFMPKFVVQSINKKDIDTLSKIFLILVPIVMCIHVVIVYIQYIGLFPPLHGYFNNGSTFGNPDMLGAYIAVLMPFCFIQKEVWKKLGYFAFLICFLLLMFIQARSAILATILCSLLWLLINKQPSLKQIIIISFLSIFLLFALILWHPESVYGRFFVWFISLKMIFEKPMGWGFFAFDKYYPEYQALYLASNKKFLDVLSPDIVHSPFNEFLNVGVSFGLIWLFLLIALVALVLYYAIKSKSQLIYPLFMFFIISLFYFPFKIAPLVALIVPIVAVVSTQSKMLYQNRLSLTPRIILFVSLSAFSLFISLISISYLNNYQKWQKAVLYSKEEGDLTKSDRLFTELYPVLKDDGRFLITYSNLRYKQGDYKKALCLLEEADLIFCDITLSLKLANLYEKLGFHNKAEIKYDLAINMAPNNFTASYEKILFLQNIGKKEDAYFEAIRLIAKPVESSIYADPYIIKSRLGKFIKEYESEVIIDSKSIVQ